MSEAVVDRLEVIDVEEAERRGPAVGRRALDFLLERLVEEAAVVEAGQRVADRLLELLAVVARVLDGDRELVAEQAEQVQLALLVRLARVAHERDVADVVAARGEP